MIRTNEALPQVRRHRAREEAWLDAAEALVVEGGLEALTIARLARRLDASVGAVYRYFPGKDAILAALGVRALGELEEQLEAAGGAGPLDRLGAMVGAYGRWTAERPARAALVQILVGDPRQLLAEEDGAALAGAMRALLGRVAVELAAAEAAALLRPGDPLDRTLQLWGGVQGILQLRKFGRFEPRVADPTPLAQALLAALLRAWAPAPEKR